MSDCRILGRKILRYKTMYFFLLPAVVSVLVFSYRPMVGVIMAFQDYDIVKGLYRSPFVGLANFREFLTDKYFFEALKNTLGINLLSILFGFPLPIMFAIVIFSIRDSLFKKVTQTISYLPHFVSWVVIAGLIYKLLDQDTGIVNSILRPFVDEPIPFMRTPEYFWSVIIITAIWKELGWNTIIYLAALSGIDAEQYEAALVDGANGLQKLVYITLPGIAPTIGLLLIFTIGTIINSGGNVSFDAVFNLRNPMVSGTSTTIDYYIYQEGVLHGNMSFSAAMGIAQNVVSLGLVLLANGMSRKIRGYGAF